MKEININSELWEYCGDGEWPLREELRKELEMEERRQEAIDAAFAKMRSS